MASKKAPQDQKRQPPKEMGVMEKKRHQIFMRRSYHAYRDLEKRINEGKQKKTKLIFTLENFRSWVQAALDHKFCPYFLDEKLTVRNFSLDHKTPISRGGHPAAEENLQVISRSANMAKGELTQDEFTDLLQTMEDGHWPREARQDVIGRLKAGAAVKRLRFLGR